MPAERRQTASQLRLKNNHQRNREEDGEAAHDPADDGEVQQLRDQRQGQENDRQTRQHLRAARSFEIEIAVINPDAEQHDFEQPAPLIEPELEQLLHHTPLARRASVVRRAAIFSFTSWTRRMSAPRSRRSAVRAIVGARRSLIFSEPIIWPREALRETPTTSGRSSMRRRGKLRSSSRLCCSVFPNPIPGSNAIAMGSMPHSRARVYCCRKNSPTSATTSS